MLNGIYAKLIGAGVFAVICLVSLAIISRHWNCDKPRPPRPPKPPHLRSLTVKSVLSGVAIEVTDGRRTGVVNLSGVALPTDPAMAELSRIHLEGLAGIEIRVEVPARRRLFGTEAAPGTPDSSPPEAEHAQAGDDAPEAAVLTEPPAAAPGLFEAVFDRGSDYVGQAWGSGGNLAEAQARAGFVTVLLGAPAAFVAAEKEAKANRRGVWSR